MAALSHGVPEAIVALDVPTADQAYGIVDRLGDGCRFYKVGLELYTAAGPVVVREIRARGADVFLDLKLHDIPNTVAGAVRSAAALGARLLTVHGSGGGRMVRAAVEAARGEAGAGCAICAVSVLTSMGASELASAWGRSVPVDIGAEVLRLAGVAAEVGAHAVVCSAWEAAQVRAAHGERLATLVPGVRLAGDPAGDQRRVATPAAAAAAGARYVVLGRTVTGAADPRAALARAAAELGAGGAGGPGAASSSGVAASA